MGRKILLITSDQQRYDSLGCNGGRIARTPVIDALARAGINYHRAYNQNTVCMPARSTMLTGQYARTHGVYANGVPLPEDALSIAATLKEKAGYKTALLGKAHFEPNMDMQQRFAETRRQATGDFGPWRGFDRAIHATHIASFMGRPVGHYGRWLQQNHPEHMNSFAPLLDASGGGDTGAPETKHNPIPREYYHTDWVADLTLDYLKTLDAEDDFLRLDELPGSAPSLGSAGIGKPSLRLARARPAARPSRLRRRDPQDPGTEAGPLARLL